MDGDDPFKRLNLDCLNIIFSSLSPADVARCERVSASLRDFAQAWTAVFGLRVHWPSLPETSSGCSEEEAFKKYKYHAAVETNLRRGKASAVHKFAHSNSRDDKFPWDQEHFVVAGDFAAWVSDGGLFWQRLSFKDDGSISRSHWLSPPNFILNRKRLSGDGISDLQLNADGYLFFRSRDLRRGDLRRDRVIYLKSGNEVWGQDIESPLSSLADPALLPLLLGKERVYYTHADQSSVNILAYEFTTGHLLYEVPVEIPIKLRKGSAYLMRDKGEEFIVQIVNDDSDFLYTVTIFEGSNGQVVQQFHIRSPDEYDFISSPDTGAFAIVSRPEEYMCPLRTIQKFERKSDGSFARIGVDALYYEGRLDDDNELHIAVHPSRQFAVSFQQSPPRPKIWVLGRSTNPQLQREVNDALETDERTDIVVDGCLTVAEPREVDLPPGPSCKNRRVLQLPDQSTGRYPRFVDGQRLAMTLRKADVFTREETVRVDFAGVYLFDFMPRTC